MFKKLLVANRGEIAVRIMATAKRMGIATVAVYSEADTNSLHVREADEAVYIGASPSVQSYLKIENILDAIQKTGADCVHPGYGFLSENADFAKALKKIGVALIGPDVKAVKAMGDKIESKKIAKKAGVSTVPGSEGAIKTNEEAKKLVKKIGYPVMIKAAAGGGGKGMRVARSDKELLKGMKSAMSEAESSFNDGRVFIERFFEEPRHIEIQILGDKKGNVVWLGERECSIQRRHQKVIEEAPSPFISDATRQKMGKQSVALAKEVGYFSAGTVEFIVDEKENFYFLEMNTRLQVEHRVTELITGIDLVEQMIRVAWGEKLPFKQADIKYDGWAMEARVYAEDPKRGFLPSIGRVTRYQEPAQDEGVMVDSGVYEGGEVSMFYDPMIAKLCTHAKDRPETIKKMQAALSSYNIQGVSHNIGFLEAILANPRFIAGDMSTNFIAQEYPEGFAGADLTDEHLRTFLGVTVFMFLRDAHRAAKISGQLPDRPRPIGSRWIVNVGEGKYAIFARERSYGYDISFDQGFVVAASSWDIGDKLFQGTINGRQVSVKVNIENNDYILEHGGAEVKTSVLTPKVSELAKYMNDEDEADSGDNLCAPIAGMVTAINVKEGDKVETGQELYIIEAMKMENVIYADHDAVVKKIHVSAPETVQTDQVIIEFGE